MLPLSNANCYKIGNVIYRNESVKKKECALLSEQFRWNEPV